MEQLFKVILSLSISGTLVGGIILLIRPVTKKYFSKRWSYYLWLLVLFRLLLPVHTGVNLINSLYTSLPEWRTTWMQEETNVSGSFGTVYWLGNDEGKELGEQEVSKHLNTGTIVNTSVLLKTAAIIWLLGIMVCALWKIYDYRRFMRAIYSSAVLTTDSRILAQREECLARLGIKRRVPVYVSTEMS